MVWKCRMTFDKLGIDCLIQYASSVAHGDLLQDVLTIMANDTHVQRVAIVPIILEVKNSNSLFDMFRKLVKKMEIGDWMQLEHFHNFIYEPKKPSRNW